MITKLREKKEVCSWFSNLFSNSFGVHWTLFRLRRQWRPSSSYQSRSMPGQRWFLTQYNIKLILSSSSCFQVPPTDKVCLWLGANVMLEYTLDDAEVLLKKNCEQVVHIHMSGNLIMILSYLIKNLQCKTFLGRTKPGSNRLGSWLPERPDDHHWGKIWNAFESFFLTFVPQFMGLFFIKNVAFQVTMARLYNWDVKRRKDQKAVAANWKHVSADQVIRIISTWSENDV